jgi:hypothetical protein
VKKKRFSVEQITAVLQQVEGGSCCCAKAGKSAKSAFIGSTPRKAWP